MIVTQTRDLQMVNTQTTEYISFGLPVWIAYLIVVSLVSISVPNQLLTFTALALPPIFARMLWRPGEPPVLFFCIIFQWLQVATKIFDANFRGLALVDYYSGWTIDEAIWLSLTGLLVLTFGIRIALFGFHRKITTDLASEAATLSPDRIWYAYLFIFIIFFFGQSFVWIIPRISQIIFMLSNFKWVLLFMLATVVISGRKNYGFLLAAVLLEMLTGFLGFFSGFKQVFFILAIVFMTFVKSGSTKMIGRLIVVFLITGYLGIIWSGIKQEYRGYISQGTGGQSVLVSSSESFKKILDLYATADMETFEKGFEAMAKRVAYVDYFARVLEVVPSYVPHSNGEIWAGAVLHVLKPRLFFPDKKRLVSDTEITERYTGYRLIEQGGNITTIPLGYFAESFIDFGRYFMFVPIFIVGIMWGLIYRYFLSISDQVLFGYSFAVAVLIHASSFEMGAIKMLGGVLMGFIVMAILQKWIAPTLHRMFEYSRA